MTKLHHSLVSINSISFCIHVTGAGGTCIITSSLHHSTHTRGGSDYALYDLHKLMSQHFTMDVR